MGNREKAERTNRGISKFRVGIRFMPRAALYIHIGLISFSPPRFKLLLLLLFLKMTVHY